MNSTENDPHFVEVTYRERGTVLAALDVWRQIIAKVPIPYQTPSDIDAALRTHNFTDVTEITDCAASQEMMPLDNAEIGALCAKLVRVCEG
jgi:hypothetical protein